MSLSLVALVVAVVLAVVASVQGGRFHPGWAAVAFLALAQLV